jgi:hypothetical protein
MSFIKPRTRGKQFMQHRTRLDRENHETLYAYAAFINEEPEYVLNELIDTVLAKDKDFLKWRAEHPQSCVPQPSTRPKDPQGVRHRRPHADGPREATGGATVARAVGA